MARKPLTIASHHLHPAHPTTEAVSAVPAARKPLEAVLELGWDVLSRGIDDDGTRHVAIRDPQGRSLPWADLRLDAVTGHILRGSFVDCTATGATVDTPATPEAVRAGVAKRYSMTPDQAALYIGY